MPASSPRSARPAKPQKQRASSPGQLATAIVAGASILLVVAALSRMTGTLVGLVPALLAQAIHLIAAFSAGRFLTRIARAAPKGALGIIVTSLALGLGFIALATLGLCAAGFVRWWTPWAVDLVALLIGITHLPEAIERLMEPLRRQEHALLVGFRVPLFAMLSLLACLHVLPALLPPTAATGAGALALASQASLRSDLPAALEALPGSVASPSQALVLHGHLAAGAVGARLAGTSLVLLLAAAVFLAAHRRFGAQVAAWAAIVLLSLPWLHERVARDPSTALVALLGFLALREISDWMIDGRGGKIALASTYGGMLIAESARGACAFAVALLVLFIVKVLVEREGLLRPLGGIAAMTAVALTVALPFVGLAVALDRDPVHALGERWVSAPLEQHVAHLTLAAPDASEDELADRVAGRVLRLGPLLLGLLLLVPLAPAPSQAFRHVVLAIAVGFVAWLAPSPYDAPVVIMAPAALAAAVAGVSALARRGIAGTMTGVFISLAAAGSVLMTLSSGPDLGAGLRVLIGREAPGHYLEQRLPDAALIAEVATRSLPEGQSVLLVGTLTDAHYPVPVRRVARPVTEASLRELLDSPRCDVGLIAWDVAAATPGEAAVLARLPLLATHGRHVLLGVPPR